MARNYQFYGFLIYVMVAFGSVSLGLYAYFQINEDFAGKVFRVKAAYKISQEEKNVMLAKARVDSFLDVMKSGNLNEVYQYWYFPTHKALLNKFGKLGQSTIARKIHGDVDTKERINDIISLLRNFEGFEQRSYEVPSEMRTRTLRLVSGKDEQDSSDEHFTRIRYTAKLPDGSFCEVCFHVYLVGKSSFIKKIIIQGPASQVSQLLENKQIGLL